MAEFGGNSSAIPETCYSLYLFHKESSSLMKHNQDNIKSIYELGKNEKRRNTTFPDLSFSHDDH